MRQIPEFDLENLSTWVVIPKRDVVSEAEEKWFQDELIRLAGLNVFGKPNLTLRWAVDYLDEMLLDDKPKYYLSSNEPVLIGHEYSENGTMKFVKRLEDVPATSLSLPVYNSVHLGERRFIVEIWRSAEFLTKSGRYQQTRDSDQVSTYFECRNCGNHVPQPFATANLDIERRCQSCNSTRVSPVDVRESGEGQLTRSLPPEGCYDYFYRIERANGMYHPPDAEALAGIEMLWQEHLKSFKEKDQTIKANREMAASLAIQQRKEIWSQL